MIARNDISDFFNLEAEASKKSWDALMKLPVKDRIRKRKTISDVYLDKQDYGMSPESEKLLQITIPLALMGMLKANKVIFAGDYKQLPPIVTSEDVKDEMRQSAFQKLISDVNCTMLNVSFRMCEPICNFVSELFYEGKVKAMKKGCSNVVICSDSQYSFNSSIIINNVEDDGEQTSDKEAELITELICTYINKYNLSPSEIAVLSPFRAQAANVRKHIRKSEGFKKEQWQNIAVDTVDKMQGQEREVIIFSMTAGNPDYIKDMAEFLIILTIERRILTREVKTNNSRQH